MSKMVTVETNVESKSEKHIRYFLVVMYFIQTFVTTFPFVQGHADDGSYASITAFNLLVQPDGYSQKGDIALAIMGGILVVFPLVSFFFCLLDKKSKIKWLISGLCCMVCAVVITFGIGGDIAFGALVTLIINLVCMFMTTQGFQATRMRIRNS